VLLSIVIVLGINWPFLATGLESISPVWMSAFRLLGATITVFVFASLNGRLSRPPRHDYPMILSVAVLRLALVFILVFTALQIVPPGRSSILTWTTALWTVPIAVAFVGDRMNPLRWSGMIVGIAGIVLVFEPTRLDWSDSRVVLGHLMLLLAAVLNAAVSVHARWHRWASSPMALLPWQLLIAALPMLVIALAVEGIPDIHWTGQLTAIVVYQGTLASGFALWAQFSVLRSLSAISTNLVLMGVPVVGLIASVVLVDESLTAGVVGGLVLVLAGIATSLLADARVMRNLRRGDTGPRSAG
jgi:drug/metabolite transporter (DMT)-like permease